MRLPLQLSKEELELAKEIAKARNAKSKRFGSRTLNNKHSAEQIHCIGFIGEIAIASLFAKPFNLEVYEDHGDKYDLTLNNVGKVEIKTTTYLKEPLLRVSLKEFDENIGVYICVAIDTNKLDCPWFIGWLHSEEVKRLKTRSLFRNGPTNYLAKESELRDPESLIRLVTRDG